MTVSSEHLEVLLAAVGDDGVVEHEAVDSVGAERDGAEFDGESPSLTLRPGDGEALARVLAALGGCGMAVRVRGGGSRSSVGNVPSCADAILSTQRMSGIVEFDAREGVCRVLAGTPLAEVREVVGASGWELPSDPPGTRATVGGVIAAAAVGPRALGFGQPRDWVLGLDVAFASGERTRCGGRVVKNVTGYDLAKLYTGSYGTLGVIESAWLRLRPAPEQTVCVQATFDDLSALCAAGIAASQRASARAAAFSAAGDDLRLTVELGGDAASVAEDANWIADAFGTSSAPGALDVLRDRQAYAPPFGLRFRIGVLPSQLAEAAEWLRAAGASLLVHPGLRSVYAFFAWEDPSERAVEDAFRNVGRVAIASKAPFVCEAASPEAKEGREMFGGSEELISLFRALKQRFDPGRVLCPGRFAGGV